MLNFVIASDDKKINNIIQETITKTMFQEDLDYNIKLFTDKIPNINDVIDYTEERIYFLDINNYGLDIAKKIRQEDWDSTIILITNHDIDLSKIMHSRICVFDLIYKFENNFQNQLIENIKQIIKRKTKDKYIYLKDHNFIISIPTKDILYITKDTSSRKIELVSTSKTYLLNYTLTKISNQLSDNFIKSHRACIINTKRVQNIDLKNNTITFDNGQTIYMLSRKFKKDVINKLN